MIIIVITITLKSNILSLSFSTLRSRSHSIPKASMQARKEDGSLSNLRTTTPPTHGNHRPLLSLNVAQVRVSARKTSLPSQSFPLESTAASKKYIREANTSLSQTRLAPSLGLVQRAKSESFTPEGRCLTYSTALSYIGTHRSTLAHGTISRSSRPRFSFPGYQPLASLVSLVLHVKTPCLRCQGPVDPATQIARAGE